MTCDGIKGELKENSVNRSREGTLPCINRETGMNGTTRDDTLYTQNILVKLLLILARVSQKRFEYTTAI